MSKLPCLLAVSLLLAATSSFAQSDRAAQARQDMQARLKAADTNGDGLIDRKEAEAGLPRIAKNFEKDPRVHFRVPVRELSTQRVLTTTFVEGKKLTDAAGLTALFIVETNPRILARRAPAGAAA